jgi:hypothetical protein
VTLYCCRNLLGEVPATLVILVIVQFQYVQADKLGNAAKDAKNSAVNQADKAVDKAK